ncbi:MAG TPA: FAD:protein FMN transferase [Cytophagales bacterium]|jgi:FAD:protein FMN transferase|nr:FAD:protein FMN transferase [Cytophagales bacterium]
MVDLFYDLNLGHSTRMNTRLLQIYFSLSLIFSSSLGECQSLKRFSFTENKMGSPFGIIFYCEDSSRAKQLSIQCFQQVDSLVNIFSDYFPQSELNQLCATAGSGKSFQCSPALFAILTLASEASKKSEGTFDITLGPLTHLWRKCRREKTFPDSATIKEKLQLIGYKKMILDSVNHSVQLMLSGMELDLGGIAQGYIAQKTIDLLKKKNIQNALVDVSGDIVCIGKPPNKSGWSVAVSVPNSQNEFLERQLQLNNCAVTTSGDIHQFIEHKGIRYSHLIDPKTGYGITSQVNVTVIAKEGTQADWLTKACSILPRKKAMKLAEQVNAGLLIVEMKKGKPVLHASKNFNHFWKTDVHE